MHPSKMIIASAAFALIFLHFLLFFLIYIRMIIHLHTMCILWGEKNRHVLDFGVRSQSGLYTRTQQHISHNNNTIFFSYFNSGFISRHDLRFLISKIQLRLVRCKVAEGNINTRDIRSRTTFRKYPIRREVARSDGKPEVDIQTKRKIN